MSDLAELNPTGRFDGLASIYAAHRPGYPPQAIDFILSHCALGRGSRLVDVGCGTGISSRLFADRGLTVTGVEPNSGMRRKAEDDSSESFPVPPCYVPGTAEHTGLPAAVADAVLAAQAFHWFVPDRALAEFHRLLKPSGWAVLMWNERDENDAFTALYGTTFRRFSDAESIEAQRLKAGEIILTHPLFRNAELRTFKNEQSLDEAGLLGRAFSASYAPKEPGAAEALREALSELFSQNESKGLVTMRYETSVYVAQRA